MLLLSTGIVSLHRYCNKLWIGEVFYDRKAYSKLMLRLAKWAVSAVVGTGATTIVLDQRNDIDLTDYPLMRAIRTSCTTLSIISDYKYSLWKLAVDSPQYEEAKSQAHSRSAKKMLDLCWRNRGCYIKVGQHLGGMDYLLPSEYTGVLKVLHSNAPQSALNEIEQVLKDDLNISSLDEIFLDFSEKPLGTASLAQVHKATLKANGATVAVKVQHPNVRDLADKDMDMMDSAVRFVKRVFPDFDLMWLTDETRQNLPIELDFSVEAQNCCKSAQNLKCFDWVKIPAIYQQYSTSRVMVMEFLEGGQVNDSAYFKKHSIDFNDVSRLLGKVFSEMIFVHGFVHSDPHPGNILVRRRKTAPASFFQKLFSFNRTNKNDLEVILLDHGLYRQLSKEFRYNYASLWQAIINTDLLSMEKHARSLGSGDLFPILLTIVTGRAWNVVKEDGIKNVEFSKEEDSAIRDGVGGFLPHISQVLGSIPREMLLVLKTNDQLRGLEHAYGVRGHRSGFLDMSRCCLRALRDLEIERTPPAHRNLLFLLGCDVHLIIGLAKINIYEWYLWFKEISKPKKSESVSSDRLEPKRKEGVESKYAGNVFVAPSGG